MRPASLDEDERGAADQRQRRAPGGGEVPETLVGAVDEQFGDAEHGDRAQRQAQRIQRPGRPVSGLRHEHRRGQRQGDHRQVHQEDPPPAQGVDQRAADQRADRRGEPEDARPEADRPGPAHRIVDRRGQRGQRVGAEQRGAAALHHPDGDQLVGAAGQRTAQRADPEHQQPRAEHGAPPEPVPDGPGQEQQHREGQRVGVHHPGQLRGAGGEFGTEGGQGDVHRGRVEAGDEQRGAADDGQADRAEGTALAPRRPGVPGRLGVPGRSAAGVSGQGGWQGGPLPGREREAATDGARPGGEAGRAGCGRSASNLGGLEVCGNRQNGN